MKLIYELTIHTTRYCKYYIVAKDFIELNLKFYEKGEMIPWQQF